MPLFLIFNNLARHKIDIFYIFFNKKSPILAKDKGF
ncbi:MAG: hypothetical protein K0S24_1314 [Sphingobacterium sp.]|jgi:hypothetical protein|nr:hypothetical protein [Sphingobacterium sp.]